MSESAGVKEYLENVSRKISTFMRRGDAFIQNIPKLIRETQAGLLTPEVLAALEVDQRVLRRRYGVKQVAEMAGVSHTLIYAAEEDGRLPKPDYRTDTAKKMRAGYTINQVNKIRAVFGTSPRKPEGADAAIIGVLNLKGGSQKTTTCHLLSQFEAIAGYRVLLLDTDPQGSLSFYYGKRADVEVFYENTMAPFLLEDDKSLTDIGLPEGSSRSLHYAVQKTYWDNIDIIPACLQNLNIDLVMPKLMDSANVPMEDRVMKLRNGLLEVGKDYDFIIVDGTPSLNLSTLNVVSACDICFIPTPAAMPDFASTLQFASLVAETIESYAGLNVYPNIPDIRFFITKYSKSSYAEFMGDIIRRVFTVDEGDVLRNEAHNSNEVGKATNSITSIYEVVPGEADNRKGLKKAIHLFDLLFGEMHEVIWDVCFGHDNEDDGERLAYMDKIDEIIGNKEDVLDELKADAEAKARV